MGLVAALSRLSRSSVSHWFQASGRPLALVGPAALGTRAAIAAVRVSSPSIAPGLGAATRHAAPRAT